MVTPNLSKELRDGHPQEMLQVWFWDDTMFTEKWVQNSNNFAEVKLSFKECDVAITNLKEKSV